MINIQIAKIKDTGRMNALRRKMKKLVLKEDSKVNICSGLGGCCLSANTGTATDL